MKAFEDAGIYVLIDMTTPTIYINSLEPEWTKSLRDAFAQVVDGFQQYNNTLGFFAGNEIINQGMYGPSVASGTQIRSNTNGCLL